MVKQNEYLSLLHKNPDCNVPEIVYGINGSLAWKNFDLSFLFQGAAHAQVYLNGGVVMPYFNDGNLPQFWVKEAWSENNPGTRYEW